MTWPFFDRHFPPPLSRLRLGRFPPSILPSTSATFWEMLPEFIGFDRKGALFHASTPFNHRSTHFHRHRRRTPPATQRLMCTNGSPSDIELSSSPAVFPIHFFTRSWSRPRTRYRSCARRILSSLDSHAWQPPRCHRTAGCRRTVRGVSFWRAHELVHSDSVTLESRFCNVRSTTSERTRQLAQGHRSKGLSNQRSNSVPWQTPRLDGVASHWPWGSGASWSLHTPKTW